MARSKRFARKIAYEPKAKTMANAEKVARWMSCPACEEECRHAGQIGVDASYHTCEIGDFLRKKETRAAIAQAKGETV